MIDIEGKCLELKIFTPLQIEEIRQFFVMLQGEEQSYLKYISNTILYTSFKDFSMFINQLIGHVVD
jgi:hypothetical protein